MRTSLLDEALDEAINEALDAAVQGHARLTPLQEMFPPDPELEAWRKEPTPPPLPPIASLKRRPSPTIKEEVAGDELPLHATEDNGIGPNTLPRMLLRSLEDPSLYRISEKDVREGHPLPMPKSEQESLERHIPRDPEDIEPKFASANGILPPGHRPNSGQDLTKDEVYTKPDGTIATRPREIKLKADPSQNGRKIGIAPAVIVQESDKHRRKHGSGKKEGERTRRKDSSRKGKGKGKEKDIQEELETTTIQVVREVRGVPSRYSYQPNTAATTLPTPPPSTASSDASFTGTQDENSPEEPEAPSSSRSDETFRERPSPTVDSPERPNLPIEPSPEEMETNQITESAGRSPLPAMDDHSLSSEEDSHPSSAPDSMDVDEPPPPITVEAPWTDDMMDVDQPPPITTHQPQQHPIEHEDEDSQTILYHQSRRQY
ncbi:hypothetical protein DFP72DRAFT_1097121 [Ephemerocybe angulata]|uniref:Uncharacterized protein n=1 Tax=Ephemerocybe angulata TaxID=980116 RepID=A0A8H6M8Z4_9AGAR|nr:hypothetical protein DFP72DRAFT_1097121 [Tulosesus angulatus]